MVPHQGVVTVPVGAVDGAAIVGALAHSCTAGKLDFNNDKIVVVAAGPAGGSLALQLLLCKS